MGPDVEDYVPCVATRGPVFFEAPMAVSLLSLQVAALANRLEPRNSSYASMSDKCSHKRRDLTRASFKVASQGGCQSRCDLVPRCRAVLYRAQSRKCILKRGCDTTSVAGPCPDTSDGSCVFAKDLTVRLQTEKSRRYRAWNMTQTLRQKAHSKAHVAMRAFPRHSRRTSACACDNSTAGLLQRSPQEVLPETMGKPWRYYTAFDCSSSTLPAWCLSFKAGILGASIGVLRASGGMHFPHQAEPIISFPAAQQNVFAHNAAILRLSHDEYVMVGGMQGFSSTKKHARAAVFTEDRGFAYDRAIGIRLVRGRASPQGNWSWSAPQVIIQGSEPPNCIDRRPKHTGYPRLKACEFDGRLSLVQFGGGFWLYARANLRYGALAGGRWAQATRSDTLERGWQPWTAVHIKEVNPDEVDLYFFVVQANPVHKGSLVALFPISQPPTACIGMAFSSDGRNFSKPVKLLSGNVVYRISAQQDAHLTARAGNHPVAGILTSGGDFSDVYIFVHHSPRGMGSSDADLEDASKSRVVRYRVSWAKMQRLTERGLRQLST